MKNLPYQNIENPSNVTSPQAMATNIERISRAQEHEAEKRMVCAILHASSLYGLIALVASGVVWTTQRALSRFVAYQALQAMLFQLSVLIASILAFGLFAAGFMYAAFSGLIAQTGANAPELTRFLIEAFMFGFGCNVFVQWIVPLWGIWAAVRILQGRSFRYPILGRFAGKWINQQPIVVIEPKYTSQETNTATHSNESVLAGLAHLSVLVGWSPILSPILWATTKHRTQFLTHHLLQAPLFQMLMTGIIFVLFFIQWGLTVFLGSLGKSLPEWVMSLITHIMGSPVFALGWMGVFGLLLLTIPILAVAASIRAFKGKGFRYPIVGSWLAHYLNAK